MKKHENAIKALMKNVKDNEKWYGYFEDENGARYLMNMHIVIKLTGSTLDYVGELPRLENIKLVKQFIDFIGTFKKGEYSANVNVDDVKIFDKYKELGECFKQQYADNKYIAFNPFYFCKLNILTGSDLLTITDNKSPMYIAGNNVECVLLPCCLGKNYNADNYADFKTLLQSYYNQDEEQKQAKQEQKALKNTDKIEKEVIYNGFTLYFAGRQLFILSDKKRVTNDITNDFLKIMTDITGIDYINKITEYDYIYYKSCIQAATITKTTSYSGNEEIYRIETKYNSENFYKNELDKLIIYNGNMEKVDISADDMSATDEETPKTATIQDNNADIVADPETTNETTAADVMSATTTETAATTDTANNGSVTVTKNTRKKLLYGFYGVFGKKSVFVVTNYENKCKPVLHAFIDAGNGCAELKERAKNDAATLDDFKKRIALATIEEVCTLKENHIRITTNNGNTIINQSLNDFKTIMLDCYSANEGITPTQETSFKFFKGISDINNRTTETMQADARQDTRQTETTQDTPHKTTKKAMCLFIVTDKPAPVKLPTLKQLDRIPTYTQRIISRLQLLKSHRVYNTRVSNKKPLKKAYNDFVSTVSHNNDKCVVGGG